MRNNLLIFSCFLTFLTPSLNATRGGNWSFSGRSNVLMIGDSLSAGPFGKEMQEYLIEKFTDNRVYVYASCGSSPEHWLSSEPPFVSKCGFRVKTPTKFLHGDFERGRPPEPYSTPKLESLLRDIKPQIVIVQLGTNWFDVLNEKLDDEQLARLRAFVERFASEVKARDPRTQLIWITPPDSSKFRRIQPEVTRLIRSVQRRMGFSLVDSSELVRYIPGQTGSDGVHYSEADARKWAEGVQRKLKAAF